ncbi:MAG: DUF1292 domain-containing protein [Bacilli bacterium]|nr:DUF1292 domain-containing protein [Bacilli bacterium]
MNSENMTIKIITEEAKEIDASVISIFEIKETGNKYAIYTFNEEDAQGLVKIYASKISEENGLYTFESISDAAEWTKIKDVMKDTAKETSNYIANGDIVLISAKSIKSKMNEPISVRLSETKAAKIGPNYKTGISNNYLNNVKDEKESVPVTPVKEEPAVVPEAKVETPEPTKDVTTMPIEPEVSAPIPEVKVDTSAEIPKVEEPKITIEPTPTFELPKIETPAPKVESSEPEVEMPSIPKFENPEPDMTPKVEVKEEYSYSEPETREMPSVDSVLNKASYFQNIEEEPKKEEPKENIIQTIGLEFMRKVSELAEYEKDLNKREREMAARERMLNKIEKEIVNKEERQKSITQANKDKELEIKKKDKELSEREIELNRRILEFNKKISMFQQTFETISGVE